MESKIPKQIKQRVEKLRQTIDEARYQYHVLDKEVMPASALDTLKHELVELEEKYPILKRPDSPTQKVAGEPLPNFVKVRHKVSQWSYNDAFSEDEVKKFDTRVKRFLADSAQKSFLHSAEYENDFSKKVGGKPMTTYMPTYTAELKIDGLKIVFEYEKGLFIVSQSRVNTLCPFKPDALAFGSR